MFRLFSFILFVAITCPGCGSKQTAAPAATQTAAGTPHAEPAPVIVLTPGELSPEQRHDAALLTALAHLADRQYPETLNALKAAQEAKDSDQVRELIQRVESLELRQTTLEQAIADIQAVLEQGQGEQAARLVVEALAQFGDTDETGTLAALKRQADALLAAQVADATVHATRYRAEAEAASKAGNLRAAVLAYDQLLALRPDPTIQQQASALRERLTRYDAARERARDLRKNPQTLDEAAAACQDAIAAWDTLPARQELAEVQLALLKRPERLAIANFDIRGDAALADLGPALADELLPHFRRRYDLVERGQLDQVLAEMKLGQDDLLISDQGRTDLGKLLKARYLIVGSVTPLSGVTVHARLVDLHSGLILQTAKIVAPTMADALKQAPRLAAQLQMTDDAKLAYAQQLSQEPAPTGLEPTATLPPLPNVNSTSPPPLVMSSNRPPAFGALQIDDFDRLPPLPAYATGAATPPPEVVVSLEQERPLRLRLLALHVELGDHYLRRGRHQEAHARFQLARELDPANLAILARINLCQPHLPPGRPVTRPRDRVAFLSFFTTGPVPLGLSTWTPDHLAPYFSPAYDVVDRGEVFWMMGRLGLTLGDVVREQSARRWLGRSLGVRYLVLGRIQHTASFTVTTSLVDAEQGFELGRGQVFARDPHELKLRLPELARLTLLSPAERARLEQQAAAAEAEYLRAQEAYERGQFGIALGFAQTLKTKHPFSIRIDFLFAESQRRVSLSILEDKRRMEAERQRQLAEAAARRQAELALAAERARQEARPRALAEAERRRLSDAAAFQLTVQARRALGNNQFSLAVQLFDGAVAFRAGDDALLREAAQARALHESHRHRYHAEQHARHDESLRRQRDLELAAARQQWHAERQRYDASLTGLFAEQRRQDDLEYTRLLDQAQRLKAQARFDQAAAVLQSARRLKPGDEIERLLADALMEQARAQAKAQDAARLAELERQLAQEQARRKQAEQEAQKNWQLYQTALQAAQDAQQRRNFAVAVAKYQEAGKLFQTDAVVTGLQAAKSALHQEAQLAAQKKREADLAALRKAELTDLLTRARTHEQARQFDAALRALRSAKDLDPANVDIQVALVRIEQANAKAQAQQQARDQAARVKRLLDQARSRAGAQQFDAALALLEAAQKLSPNDALVAQELAAVKQAQAQAQAALLAKKQKDEEARKLAEQRIQQEEQAKRQADQARQAALTALKTGDLKAAEAALATAARLAPKDPALRSLQQELTRAQNAAARERTQADARARLEAEAQRRASAAASQEQTRINELLRQSQQAIVKKDYPAAEKLINDAIALDPTNLAIGRAQRDLQAARQADDKARSAMTAAQKKKDDAELARKKEQFNKLMKDGKEALAEQDFDKAAKLFEAATKLNPEDADAPLLLGMARRDVERTKAEAEAARKAALEEEARQKKEEEDAKKKAMTEADAKKKAEMELRNRLAKDAEAKKRADALKALNKTQFDAAMKSGQQALTAKRYADAVKAFERATQLQPDHAEARQQLDAARKLAPPPNKTPDKKTPNKK